MIQHLSNTWHPIYCQRGSFHELPSIFALGVGISNRGREKKRNISNQTCYQLTNRCTVENKSKKERKRNIKESSRESTNSHEGKKKESRREMLNRFSRLGTYRHSLRFSSPFQSPKPYSAHNLWVVVVVVVVGYNRLPSRLHTYFPHVERQPPYLCRLAS